MSDEQTPISETQEPTMFTQEQVNSFVADAKRKEREKFSDYDDLKARLGEFESKQSSEETEIGKLRRQVEEMAGTLRAETQARERAEKDAIRTEVAAATGVNDRYLTGATREEMEEAAETFRKDARALIIDRTPPQGGRDSDQGPMREDSVAKAAKWAEDFVSTL